MTKMDNRAVCSDDKRAAIRATRRATALRRVNQAVRVFECKIVEKRLNSRQREELKMLFVEGKWFYNHILNIHRSGLALSEINTTPIRSVTHFDRDGKPVTTRIECLSAQQKQAILSRMLSNERTIITLVRKGLQTHGNLRFKSELNCVPLKQYGISYKFKSFNRVKIQGVHGDVLVRTGGQLQGVDELANANLVRKPDGYYLMVTTYTNKENLKKQETNGKEIGLDFGIKTNITTSEGEKIDVSVEEGERLKRMQRELHRRLKGSNNRFKTIKLIQREYQKLSNRKQDKANKIVSKLKKYDCVVLQDEQIANWHRGLFGKQVQHSCMGLVKAKLKRLPQAVVLDKWIPTTKWCPKCGRKHALSLSDRTFACECGYAEDRDIHSAKNMLAIKNLVFSKHNFVPAEHREVTLMEFKTSVCDAGSVVGKPEC